MITGKIRVENFRGMSTGIYDEANRLHLTGVSERADLQAICDGYNAMLDVQAIGGEDIFKEPEPAPGPYVCTTEIKATLPEFVAETTGKRGRGRPRKEPTVTE